MALLKSDHLDKEEEKEEEEEEEYKPQIQKCGASIIVKTPEE